jgi:phosphotransferase system HPr-like phosphotransfer protein
MLKSNKLLREKLASLPITDAAQENALRLVAQGESIADALQALSRLFHRVPALHHVSHSH